jgi:hypothetical protein
MISLKGTKLGDVENIHDAENICDDEKIFM